MDFDVSDEAGELVKLTGDLAVSGRPLWPALAEAGVLGAGLEYGLVEQTAVLTELGRHAATVPYLTTIVAASALARFDQSFTWDGSVLAVVHNGQVHGIRPTPAAVLVPTPTGVFLVEDAVVEPQQVEGGPGTGLLRSRLPAAPAISDPAAADWIRARLTVGAAAYQLGIVDRALELTAEYARTRVQFGRPIGSFQAVSQRLADAYIDVEALRVALCQAVSQPSPAEVATAGFWAAEAGHRVLHTCVHVHGGVGIDLEYPLHRYFLAAEYHEFLLGGATAQLLALSEVLT